jgi:DHA1 family tetracycline resistance protein-like MFS transporter
LNIGIFFTMLIETKMTQAPATSFFKQFFKIMKQKPLCLMILSFFFFELAWSLYFQSLSLVLVKLFNAPKHLLGVFSLYIGIVLSLGLVYLVRACIQRLSLSSILFANQLIMAASFAVLLALPFLSTQWVCATTIALTVALIYTAFIAKISDAAPSQQQGFILGLTDAALALAFAVSGFLAGTLSYFNIHLPNFTCLISILLGLVLFYFANRTQDLVSS